MPSAPMTAQRQRTTGVWLGRFPWCGKQFPHQTQAVRHWVQTHGYDPTQAIQHSQALAQAVRLQRAHDDRGADGVLEVCGLWEIVAGERFNMRREGAARWRESLLPHARAFHNPTSIPLMRWCKAAEEFPALARARS